MAGKTPKPKTTQTEKEKSQVELAKTSMSGKNLKLKAARVEKDMSQVQLAEAIGVSRQTINMIETGNFNPSLALCISICRVLGRTLDQLFWKEDDDDHTQSV